ncbi:MAG: phage major capsid protein [Mycobacterium sp.]|nr:phage major capsid protein [Mycobacterium sp.]
MALNSQTGAGIIVPESVGPLIVDPLKAASTAIAISTNVSTSSPSFRIPIVAADPAGGWYAEGSDISLTDAEIAEINVVPKKMAVLSKISNELANDSSPAAAQVIGEGMSRSIARKLDAAFFGNTVANGPSGLLSLSDVSTVAGGDLTDLDPFAEAISALEAIGCEATAFVASATDTLHLQTLKAFDGATQSNQPLLSPTGDATSATKRQILGVPLYTVPDGVVEDGTIWALDRSRSFVVMRQDVQLEVDRSVYFASDSVGIRAIIRVGFGFPTEPAICKITWGASS